MKNPGHWSWTELRHRLVLTSEEKRVISFVIAALVLGAGTKACRDAKSQVPVNIERKHSISRQAYGATSGHRE